MFTTQHSVVPRVVDGIPGGEILCQKLVIFRLGMALYFYFSKIKLKLYFLYFSGKHFIWAKNHFGEAEKKIRTLFRKIKK